MKYEKDFFTKINCYANEWYEGPHLKETKTNRKYDSLQ